jgi:serine/threonine-protein kinase
VIFDLLFNNTYVQLALVAFLLMVVYRKVAPMITVRTPAAGSGVDDLMSKVLGSKYQETKLLRQVARYKKSGHHLIAGKALEEAGRSAEAVDVYLEGQEHFAAAATLEKMGRLERAAELYLQSGDYKKAAQVFIDTGKPSKAAGLFLEKGNTLEAARLFGVAGEWGKAADLYHKGGYPLRAAEGYEKVGEFLKAAECQEKHFMENVSFGTSYSSTAPSADQKSALQAGRLYEKAGDLKRAVQIYSRGGYFREAAAASAQSGQFAHAAELYMRGEDPSNAADAYERAGDKVKAANLRGEVALKQEKVADAAAHFQEGQDYLRAAELFESVGQLARAAGAYEAGDSWAAAGGVYIRAGLKEKAAASYEKAGDYETAATLYEQAGQMTLAIPLYEKAGLTYKSGEAAALAGDRDRAIALLQKVPSTDENYRAAVETLARLFIESGRPALAVERLQKAIGGQPVSSANLDLHYWLAAAQEGSNPAEALAVYKKIQADDLGFRDVSRRVARLEGGGAPAPPAAAVASPAPRPAAAPAAAPPAANPSPAPAAAAPRPSAAAPTKSTRFVSKEEVGRGALGTVFRAEDSMDGRSVALRVLPASVLEGDGVLASLAGDLKAAAQLSHPNGVKVLGFLERDGQRCVVSEFVQGRNFAEAVKSGHKMTVQQAHSLGRVLAQYLSFVHGKGMVHGSIKPSNLMVANGVIKVADLGFGRLVHKLPSRDYRAPEDKLDVAGDLYALSAVLYHFITGVHPKSQAQGAGLPLPSTLAPGVPEALDKLLLRGLHPRVELRHTSADEVLHELKDMVRLA